MSILGPFGFAAPWVLLALLALPLIWIVVRAIPPRPNAVRFPPIDIVRTIPKTQETPAKPPPWLAVLRAVALALVILGLSGPVLNPQTTPDNRPLLIVIDDGWTAAPVWREMIDEASATARAATGPVRIVTTAPKASTSGQDDVLVASSAAARLAASAPQPLLSDHRSAMTQIAALPRGQRIVWFSDNVGRPNTAEFAQALTRLGSVSVRVIASPVVALTRLEATQTGYNVGYNATSSGPANFQIEALNAKSRTLTTSPATRDQRSVMVAIETALTRDVAALRTSPARSAGGVFLLDAFDRRVRTGIVAARQDDQPLLSDAFYLAQALGPYAEVTRGDINQLVASGLDVILMPDAAQLPPTDEQALMRFVENGGLLVRFSGPRLISAGNSPTLPAPINDQARVLRGALAWDDAGSLAPFDRDSPFAGLTIPAEARANQIAVFAARSEGAPENPAPQKWARLSDDTPLVSASPYGRGWRVLFHTTAGPAWSDVAFSGLQVSMLRRVLARANSTALPAAARAPSAPLKPVLVLDGFGAIRSPSPDHQAIAPQALGGIRPDARHPPGIYEGGGSRLILQAAGPETLLPPLPALPNVERVGRAVDSPTPWGPPLLTLGLALIVADMLIALAFAGGLTSGGLARLGQGTSWAKSLFGPKVINMVVCVLAVSILAWPQMVLAQAAQLPPPASSATAAPARAPADVSLAFIKTGDAATDARAKLGLEGLSRVLAARTSVEPGAVIGVDPTAEDLALYPLLYWLLPDNPTPLPPESARALDRYMKTGGVIFVDTRGAGRDPAIARGLSRTALRGLEAPPLEPVPDGHVLTKSFYLLRGFPGRYPTARLWVETAASAASSANDGVSPLIVGDGDWASAWARATPVVGFGALSGPQRDQEIATRVGVNIVLYALTGNYKADQVHFETLLRRLTPR